MSQYQIAAVLCKKLIDGKMMGLELQSRVDYLIGLMQEGFAPDAIIFSGGRKNHGDRFPEAIFAREHFLSAEGIPKPTTIADTESQNTRDNIRYIVEHIGKNYAFSDVELTLISTDYHIERLRKIHERTPKKSILIPATEAGIAYPVLEGTPYLYGASNEPAVRLRSGLYLISDALRITSTNLEGIADGSVDKINATTVDDYRKHILEVSELLYTAQHAQLEEQQAVLAGLNALSLLSPWNIYMGELLQKESLSTTDRQTISATLPSFVRALQMLTSLDPDQPV